MDVIKLERRVNELTEEHCKMVEEKSSMGQADAEKRRGKAMSKYNEYKDQKTRIEGRKQGLDEQKRALKRKLREP
jgi:hypothetical protein